MKGLFSFLEIQMTAPTNYGVFHLISMILIVGATVALTFFFKDCEDRTFRRIALSAWIVMLVFEGYKQFIYTFSYTEEGVVSDYQWYAFPYQFCSTPMYVLPFVAFMREGKAREFFSAYLASFALFGGLVVFFYPNDVFCDILGVNVQTMVHYGLQVVLGIFIAVHERKKLNLLYFCKAIAVFAVLSGIAIAANEAVFYIFQNKGIDETFNMFYISSHFPVHLPVLSTVYEIAPYPVFLMAYLVGFTVAAGLVLGATFWIVEWVKKKRAKAA